MGMICISVKGRKGTDSHVAVNPKCVLMRADYILADEEGVLNL